LRRWRIATIREVLAWLKQKQSPIRAYIENEYQGSKSAVEEVKASRAFAARMLTSYPSGQPESNRALRIVQRSAVSAL
jgi:hypothetical protein